METVDTSSQIIPQPTPTPVVSDNSSNSAGMETSDIQSSDSTSNDCTPEPTLAPTEPPTIFNNKRKFQENLTPLSLDDELYITQYLNGCMDEFYNSADAISYDDTMDINSSFSESNNSFETTPNDYDLSDMELFSKLNDTYNLGIDLSEFENITNEQLELLSQAYLMDVQKGNLEETKENMLKYFDTLGIADKAYDGAKELIGVGITKEEVEQYYNNEEAKQEFLTSILQNGGEITVDSETLEKLEALSKYSEQDISNVKEGDILGFNQAYKLATGADYNPELISQVMQSQDTYEDVVNQQSNALAFEQKMANSSPKQTLQYFDSLAQNLDGTTGEELFNEYYQTMFEKYPKEMSYTDSNGLKCSSIFVQDGYLWQELSFPEGYSDEDKEFIAQNEFLYSKQDDDGNTKYYKVANLENEQQVLSNISGKDDTYNLFGFANTYENSPIAMFNKANDSIKDNNLYLEKTKQSYNEKYGENAFDITLEEYPKMYQEAFGKNVLAEKLSAYENDMDSYAGKLSQAASIACFAASFIPGVNLGMAPILLSAGLDNAIDLANLSTNNKDGEIGAWTRNLAVEAGMFAVGIGIGSYANTKGHQFVANKIARGSQFVMNHAAGVEAAAEYAVDNLASVAWDLGKGIATGEFTNPDGTINSKALIQTVGSNLLFNAADLRNGMSLYRNLNAGQAVDIGNGVKFQIDNSTGSVKYIYSDNSQVKIENGSAVKINPDGTTTDLYYISSIKSWITPDAEKIDLKKPQINTETKSVQKPQNVNTSTPKAKHKVPDSYTIDFDSLDIKSSIPIPEVNPKNIDADSLCLVHMTNHAPEDGAILSSGDAMKATTGTSGARNSVHFTLNHAVNAHGNGDWDNMKYAIVMPYNATKQVNPAGKFIEGLPEDFYTNGSVKMPDGSIILKHNDTLPQGQVKVSYCDDNPSIRIIESSGNIHDMVDPVLQKMGYQPQKVSSFHNSKIGGVFKDKHGYLSDNEASLDSVKNYDAWAEFCKKEGITPVKNHNQSLNGRVENAIHCIDLISSTGSWRGKDMFGLTGYKKDIVSFLKDTQKAAAETGGFTNVDMDQLIKIVEKSRTPNAALAQIKEKFNIQPLGNKITAEEFPLHTSYISLVLSCDIDDAYYMK